MPSVMSEGGVSGVKLGTLIRSAAVRIRVIGPNVRSHGVAAQRVHRVHRVVVHHPFRQRPRVAWRNQPSDVPSECQPLVPCAGSPKQ